MEDNKIHLGTTYTFLLRYLAKAIEEFFGKFAPEAADARSPDIRRT
jgi:hypothetical protein